MAISETDTLSQAASTPVPKNNFTKNSSKVPDKMNICVRNNWGGWENATIKTKLERAQQVAAVQCIKE